MSGKILINTGPSERGAHRLDLIQKCLRLYAYHKLLGFYPGPRMPLTRGTMLHIMLAHHYQRMMHVQRGLDPDTHYTPEDALTEYVRRLREKAHATARQVDADELALALEIEPKVRAVYAQYKMYYTVDHKNYEILGAEVLAEGKINGQRVTQRYDLVMRNRRDGKTYIMDHTGVYFPDAKTLERYTLSIQFLIMQYGGHKLFGGDFGGAKVQRCSFGEKTEFARDFVPPAPEALEGLEVTIAHREWLLAEVTAREPNPWKWPMAVGEQTCIGPYGKCDAYEVCRWGRDRGVFLPPEKKP